MEKIKKQFFLKKSLGEKIKKLEKSLSKARVAKEQVDKECKHELVFVFKKVEYSSDLISIFGKCLLCNHFVDTFNCNVKDFNILKEEKKEEFVDENTLIDATLIVPKRTLELYNCGDYCSAVRARAKFLTLINSDSNLTREELKQMILEDALKYDQELFGIPEYTEEEIRIAMQPDDNTEIINAVCEECVDLCSENAKRKIK